MNDTEKLSKLILEKNGLILTADVSSRNIPRELLNEFTKKGLLLKIDRGAYLAPDAFDDEMFRMQTRFKQIIFSHETALFFHDLTDRTPINYTVTVRSGDNATKLREIGVNVFSIKKELFEFGLIESKTILGRTVRMYDVERTLCDCLRSRSKVDIGILTDALKRYAKGRNKDIPKLMRYAEKFGVSNILRGYLEVLL